MLNIRNIYQSRPPTRINAERVVHSGLSDFQYKSLIVAQSEPVGLEIEVEGIAPLDMAGGYLEQNKPLSDLVVATTDGSLRNNGIEYKTFPIWSETVPQLVGLLYDHLHATYRKPEFSIRCGIHVHIDVGDLTPKEVLSYLVLYTAFEHLFFSFVPEERLGSNYCVPFKDTDPDELFDICPTDDFKETLFAERLPSLDRVKYLAVNVGHIRDFNTLEFRHLPGTWNIQDISTFIRGMVDLKRFVKGDPLGTQVREYILTVNSISHYTDFTRAVFRNPEIHSRVLPNHNATLLSRGVERAKAFYNKYVPSRLGIAAFARNSKLLSKFERLAVVNANSPNREGMDPRFIPPLRMPENVQVRRADPAGGVRAMDPQFLHDDFDEQPRARGGDR